MNPGQFLRQSPSIRDRDYLVGSFMETVMSEFLRVKMRTLLISETLRKIL